MNPKLQPPPPAPAITLADVYYIVFRHKWLILTLSVAAAVAAVAALFLVPVAYDSEAEILIKYVKEVRPPDQDAAASQLTSPDSHGEDIINTEIKILTSLDLANNVVDALTPARILAKAGGGTNKVQAAFLIRKNLTAEVTNRSDVIDLEFQHPDPDMVQPILSQLIDCYLKRHNEIHRPEFNEFLTSQTDEVKHKLDETESRLRETKSQAGVGVSLDDSERAIADSTAKIQEQIYDAQADLAGDKETITQERKMLGKPAPMAASTNTLPVGGGPAPVPPEKVAEYQRLRALLLTEQNTEQTQRAIYMPNNANVQAAHAQVLQSEAQKADLEKNFPGLLAVAATPIDTKGSLASSVDPALTLNEDIVKAEALEAKIKVLTNELAEVRGNAAAMAGQEGTILQLQRDRDMEDAEFTYYSKRLEEARTDEVLGAGNSNISEVEMPTPAARNMQKLHKKVIAIFLGGLALAFGLPFLIELVLDRSLKHPTQVQTALGLPFFISIPAVNGNGATRSLKGAKKLALLAGKTEEKAEAVAEGAVPAVPSNGHLTLWDASHGLQSYYETLRDRLMTYFEMINLTHKPKLVAVTSCASGAGVTSTAAGLASSLSETGDGNVLLVNMNVRDGEAHHFYKGKLACGLDEVLEKGTRGEALVQGNLYVAREVENDDKLPRILPKRFNHLLPKMKASDFDYIIFDMPPVSQISITPRLARFMDMVLLVVESEKTDRDMAKRVAAMLSESKTNVGVVLNKNRSYLPRKLHQEV